MGVSVLGCSVVGEALVGTVVSRAPSHDVPVIKAMLQQCGVQWRIQWGGGLNHPESFLLVFLKISTDLPVRGP